MVKRYKIGFRVCTNPGDKLELLWDGGEMVNLNEVLEALQTVIDQLGESNPEWRNGAVLAYNAIACSEADAAVKRG
jgi:hypothetical protein